MNFSGFAGREDLFEFLYKNKVKSRMLVFCLALEFEVIKWERVFIPYYMDMD